jgi:2-polyprenyl-6-hydroxyphenyl methylase / 3-demethylubiquinone-9 3-methyltransferase
MSIAETTGVFYNPFTDSWNKSRDTDVNYMVLAVKA